MIDVGETESRIEVAEIATTQEITQDSLDERVGTARALPGKPGRYVWNRPLQVQIGDSVEYCQAPVIWDGGLGFAMKREMPTGSRVQVRRHRSDVEPWVDVRIEAAAGLEDRTVIVEGAFLA